MRSCRVPVRGPAVAASTAHANIGTNVFAAVKSSARRNFDWSYMDARSAMAVDARSIMGVHLSLTATFCSSGVSRSEHWPPFSYCRSAARSRLRLQWAAHAPSSAHGHQFPEFFLAAEAERHFVPLAPNPDGWIGRFVHFDPSGLEPKAPNSSAVSVQPASARTSDG